MRLRLSMIVALACWLVSDTASAQPVSLVERIDASLEAAWSARGVAPASPASDAAFLRRVSLDLAGVTPSLAEAEQYLTEDSANRREALVDRLLASPRYANHMAATWRDLLIPADGGGFQRREQAIGLENWLRDRFGRNVRYDNVVYDLLVATDASDLGPASYFSAHELKPEKLAANTTELLLGVSLECAQCHDHPYTSWTEQDFWGFAAFFARVRPADSGMRRQPAAMVTRLVDADRGELVRPDRDDDEPIPPRFLGGEIAEEDEFETRRERLALWMAERENPYLARAAVNAAWRRLFGAGLVDEIDADGAHLPEEHAALLDEIAESFVASGYDLKWLWKQITLTRAYGLAAARDDPPPVRAFAAMRPRRLTAEQLVASIGRLSPSPLDGGDPFQIDPGREEFVRRMRASLR